MMWLGVLVLFGLVLACVTWAEANVKRHHPHLRLDLDGRQRRETERPRGWWEK